MAIMMLATALLAFPHTAAAAVEFTPRFTAPQAGNAYYNSTLNVYSKYGYGMPNCTAYAYGRIYEITGEAPKITRGSAGDWWYINIKNGYYDYGSEAKLGAIACWSRHVAVVEAIDGSEITISQSHWHGTYFDVDIVTEGASRYGQTFYGYIYACDICDVEDKTQVKNTQYKLEKAQYECVEDRMGAASFGKMISSCLHSDEPETQIIINSIALRNILL